MIEGNYFYQLVASDGSICVLSREVQRFSNFFQEKPGFIHISSKNMDIDKMQAKMRDGRILKTELSNRAERLKELKRIYPGCSIKDLQVLGFNI